MFLKYKILRIFFIFLLGNFKICKIRDSSVVALLILRHILIVYEYLTIDHSLKTMPLVAFPVNPYCWSKSAEHHVTLTSLMTDSKWPPSLFFFFNMCRIVAGRGTANFKAKFPVLQELFAKNYRRYKDDKSFNSGQIPISWLN